MQPQALIVPALSYGPEVAKMWGSTGKVLGMAGGALYLESSTGKIAGIVGPGAPDGPLTLRVAELASLEGVVPSANFRWTGDALEVGDVVSVTFGQARCWQPEVPRHAAPHTARVEAAQALAVMARGQHARLVSGVVALMTSHKPDQPHTPGDPAIEILLESLDLFRLALREVNVPNATRIASSMLGLGPGLTPSGDDILAGIVAALAWRAELGDFAAHTAGNIAEEIAGAAPQRTNKISARLLAHACEGTLYAPAMELGTALLLGNPIAAAIAADRLVPIGATTGSDLAAGLSFGALL